MKEVSIYKSAIDSVGARTRPIQSIMEAIKSGTFAEAISLIREEKDKDVRDGLKKKLLSFTPAGVFDRRTESGLTTPAHMIVLDVDYSDPKKCMHVAYIDDHVRYGFVSPSGNGYKYIVPIAASKDIESWKDYYYNAFAVLAVRFKDKYNIDLDPSGKNINRICFVSYDPNLVDKEAKPIVIDPTPPPMPEKKVYEGEETNDLHFKMNLAIHFVNQHKEFSEGQRNNYVHELAATLNRMGVEQDEAESLIDQYYDLPGFSEPDNEWVKTINSAYKHNKDEHGTKVVTVTETAERPVFKEGSIEMNTYRTLCDILRGVENIDRARDIIKHYHIGKKKIDPEYNIDKDTFVSISNTAYNDVRAGENLQSMSGLADYLAGVFEYDRPPVSFDAFNIGAMDGWIPGNCIGVVGCEGTYKSFYALTEAINCAEKGIPSYYGNYEMSEYQLVKRLGIMLFGEDIDTLIKNSVDKKDTLKLFMKRIFDRLGDNLLIHSKQGAKPNEIANTIESHELKTGKKIRFGVVDGIWGLHQWYKDEISSAIKNAQEVKEMVKRILTPFLVLSHSKTGTEKHFRNQHDYVLGGRKILSNLDGFIAMSKIIDQNRSNMDEKDYIYRDDFVWMRYDNRREGRGVIDVIGEIGENLRILETNFNPRDYEIKSTEGSRRRLN